MMFALIIELNTIFTWTPKVTRELWSKAYLVTFLIRRPMFYEWWYVIWCGSKEWI